MEIRPFMNQKGFATFDIARAPSTLNHLPGPAIKHLASRFTLGLLAALSAISIQAATVYWDINGATAGAGAAVATGNWGTGTATWGDSAGTAVPANWVNGDSAVFSAGTDASGTFVVTLNTPV